MTDTPPPLPPEPDDRTVVLRWPEGWPTNVLDHLDDDQAEIRHRVAEALADEETAERYARPCTPGPSTAADRRGTDPGDASPGQVRTADRVQVVDADLVGSGRPGRSTGVGGVVTSTDHTASALAGPWTAVLTEPSGYVLNADDLVDWDEMWDDLEVSVVRDSAAPVVHPDDVPKLPGSWKPEDVLYRVHDFDDEADVQRAWTRAKAVAAALNAQPGTDQPRTWTMPAEPGPEVTAVRDFRGFLWERTTPNPTDADVWMCTAGDLPVGNYWGDLVGGHAPLTDATEAARNTQTGDDHG